MGLGPLMSWPAMRGSDERGQQVGMATKTRTRLLTLLKAVVGLGLIVLVVCQADWPRLVDVLSGTDLALFAAACAAHAAAIAANAWRWMVVTRHLGTPMGPRDALVGSFEANFFNQFLPSSVGGDPIKALRAYDAGAGPGQALLGVLIDRAYGLWFMTLCVVVLMAGFQSPVESTPAFPVIAIAAALAAVGAIAAVGVGALPLEHVLPRWLSPLWALVKGFSGLARHPVRLAEVAASLVISNAMILASFIVCGRALGLAIGPVDGALVMFGMLLAAMIPVSLGGWGVREGVAVLLLTATGASAAQAVAVSFLFGLAMSVVALAGGAMWALSPYRRISAGDALSLLRRDNGSDLKPQA